MPRISSRRPSSLASAKDLFHLLLVLPLALGSAGQGPVGSHRQLRIHIWWTRAPDAVLDAALLATCGGLTDLPNSLGAGFLALASRRRRCHHITNVILAMNFIEFVTHEQRSSSLKRDVDSTTSVPARHVVKLASRDTSRCVFVCFLLREAHVNFSAVNCICISSASTLPTCLSRVYH